MPVFDTLKSTLNKGVAAVSVKSETLVESSRIKSAISNAQKKIDVELNTLGVKFYQAWKAGQVTESLFTEDFARIQGLEKEITDLNAKLEQIKVEEDKILGAGQKPAAALFCTNCGKPLPADARFCNGCGTPVGAPPAGGTPTGTPPAGGAPTA